MSEEQAAEVTPEAPSTPQDGAEPKMFDADYVAKLRQESAKYRTDAKANADAAKRLAEIEEAQKSGEQKAAERVAAAEARAVALELQVARAEIANEVGIPVDVLAGPADNTQDAIKAWAQSLKALIDKAGQPRAPKLDPLQGVSGSGNPIITSPGLGTLRAAYETKNTH